MRIIFPCLIFSCLFLQASVPKANDINGPHDTQNDEAIFEKRMPSRPYRHKSLASWNGDNSYTPWPNAQVPYVLDDAFPTFMKDRIHQAMQALSSRTCLSFIDIENTSPSTNATATNASIQNFLHSLHAKHESGQSTETASSVAVETPSIPKNFLAILFHPRIDFLCAALGIGMHSGTEPETDIDPNIMILSKACDAATIVHELLHVIGFDHEMTRNDRNSFIDIRAVSDPSFTRERFQVAQRDNSRDLFGYDYYSIMHYGDNALRYRGIPIMSAPVGITDFSYLRASDQAAVNFVYGCARKVTKRDSSTQVNWKHEQNPPLRCTSSVSKPESQKDSSAANPKIYLRPGVPFKVQFTAMKAEQTPDEDFVCTIIEPQIASSKEILKDVIQVTTRAEKASKSTLSSMYSYLFGESKTAPLIGSSVCVDLLIPKQHALARLFYGKNSYPAEKLFMGVEFTLKSTAETVKSIVELEIITEENEAAPVCFGQRGRNGCNGHGKCALYKNNAYSYGYCECDAGWKGERCQINTKEMCTGSYAIRFNSEMDTSVLFPPTNATLSQRDKRQQKTFIDSLQFTENIASPYSRSTFEGKRGGIRVDDILKVYLRSLTKKAEPENTRITPGRITLSMILPLGLSKTEIHLYSSANPNERFRIPIAQSAIGTRSLPFTDMQEFLPEANAYTFFDITPNYDRGDLAVRVNGDVMWMTIFSDSNDHFHPDACGSHDQANGQPLAEIDMVEVIHTQSGGSGPCFIEEITMECRVSIEPKVTTQKEIVVHDETQSFLLRAPTPEDATFSKDVEVFGNISEQYADSIITLEGGKFTLSGIPNSRAAGVQHVKSKDIDIVYAVSSSIVNASGADTLQNPKRDVNTMMVFLNANILSRNGLAAPILFANRFSEHRGHCFSFDMTSASRTCFLSDVQKGGILQTVINGSNSVRNALRIEEGSGKLMETLSTPIHCVNSVTFSFRIPVEGGSEFSRAVYYSQLHALMTKNLFTFTVIQQGRATQHETFEVRVGMTRGRNMQVLYASPGMVEPYATFYAGLLFTYKNQPTEYIEDNEWYTVVIEAAESATDDASIAVYRDADKKLVMHQPIQFATREAGFLSNVRAFHVTNPSCPLEISEIHFSHASRPDRVVHSRGQKNAPKSESEALVERATVYKDSIRAVDGPGTHPFEIRAGSRSFVRIKANGSVEHAVPALDGVLAHSVDIALPRCALVAGHQICSRHRVPELMCYVDPSLAYRPFSVQGNLVCRNSTKYGQWLGTEHLISKRTKQCISDIQAYLEVQKPSQPLKRMKEFFERHLRAVSSAKVNIPEDISKNLLTLRSGVRDLTAGRAVQRAKALAGVSRLLTDGHPEWQKAAHWRLENTTQISLWEYITGTSNKKPTLLEDQAAKRKAFRLSLPKVVTKAVVVSTWWDAVDDALFVSTEVLPRLEAVMEKAAEFTVAEKPSPEYQAMQRHYSKLCQAVAGEMERLFALKAIKEVKSKSNLSTAQEALLIEYDKFLEGIQQHAGAHGIWVDLTARFLENPREDLDAFLNGAEFKRNASVSKEKLVRNVAFLSAALEDLCEFNRIAFEKWDEWIAETIEKEKRTWRF